MPHQGSRRRRPEVLARTVRVESWASRVSLHVEKGRALPSRLSCDSWLELRGSGDEPIREVGEFRVHLHIDDLEQARSGGLLAIGHILQTRPHVHALVRLPRAAFDHVWAMATSGQLRYCYLVFSEPKRGSAPIVSTYFSNEEPE
jgi:hypothetical protein